MLDGNYVKINHLRFLKDQTWCLRYHIDLVVIYQDDLTQLYGSVVSISNLVHNSVTLLDSLLSLVFVFFLFLTCFQFPILLQNLRFDDFLHLIVNNFHRFRKLQFHEYVVHLLPSLRPNLCRHYPSNCLSWSVTISIKWSITTVDSKLFLPL